MTPISTVLLLAMTILSTSNAVPIGNHSVDIHHSSLPAEQKISKIHPIASVNRKLTVEEKLPDRSADDQKMKNGSESELETVKPGKKVPEDMCDFIFDTCKFGKCVPKSVYPEFECQCDPGYEGPNCEWDTNMIIGLNIFCGAMVILPVICLCIFACIKCCQRQKNNSASVNKVKSGKTATIPSLTAVVCETEITPDSSSNLTPNSVESTVTGVSSTEMIRG